MCKMRLMSPCAASRQEIPGDTLLTQDDGSLQLQNFDSELPRSSTQLDCKVMTELAQVATRMHLPD
jgi:hypothetical protein